MTVTLRKRELKDKGRFALYLDIYIDKKQYQENLKLYLENEKGNPTTKQMNKQTLAIAERIRVERLYQIQNESYGFKKPTTSYINFNKFFCELWKEREKTGVNFGSWDSVYKHINSFNKNILFTELNERLMEDFKAFLLARVKQNSASQYFTFLNIQFMKHIEENY